MLNKAPFYHGTIRKTIVAFGLLFSDIKIERHTKEGVLEQVVDVPIGYAPKEKWIVRIDSDPNLNNHTYTTLPRMSFEITGYNYDSTRKTNRMNKVLCEKTDGTRSSTFAPVPYNIDISLYILTKTQEDAMQVIEQILPIFTPEYTMSVMTVPEMNVVQDIPVILNSVQVVDEYDGDFETRRFVTHTLNFTVKVNLFGDVTSQGVIKKVMANTTLANYTAEGTLPGDPIVENWTENL